jgi:hypothetical protein
LTRGTPTAHDCRQFEGRLEEIFSELFVFENKGETFAVDDQDLTEIAFDLFPKDLPIFIIIDLFNLNIRLSGFLETTGSTDALSSFHFVPCDHPDLDTSTSDIFDGRLEIFLKFVLNACNS